MDKFRDDAILAYDNGTRAYAKDTGSVFQKADGTQVSVRVWGLWYALRAYQDEQRKKGVPITMYIGDWQNRDYFHPDGQELVFFLTKEDRPEIAIYSPGGFTAHQIGRFTNFRWREGYPKTTNHIKVIGDGVVDLSESPLVYRYPKGGQNG